MKISLLINGKDIDVSNFSVGRGGSGSGRRSMRSLAQIVPEEQQDLRHEGVK